MTAFDPTNFLHSLGNFIVATAAAFTPAATIAYGSTPRQLFREKAIEDGNQADPYTVMRIYGGPPLKWHQLNRLSVQFQTTASDSVGDEAGLAQSFLIFRTLIDADSHPLRMKGFNGFKAADNSADGTYELVYLDPLQRPGKTGVDDRGRSLFTWNCEIGVNKTS